MLKDKNLLMLSNGYPSKDMENPTHTFVKEQVDELSKYFNKIYVIALTPFFPQCLRKIKLVPEYFRSKSILENYNYKNIEVYFPRYFALPIEAYKKTKGDYAYKEALKSIKKYDIKFDLIHAQFTWPSGYAGYQLKNKYNKKLILTIEENRNWFLTLYNSRNKKILNTWRNCDLIIRVNKKDIPLLKKYNKNIINIPNGYNSRYFKEINKELCRRKLSLPKDKKIVVNIANYIISHKNQINLLKAFKKVLEERKDVILFLIGSDAGDQRKIQNKIKELNIENNVKIIGARPHNEIPLWMNAADIFVLPSYAEGNPTVMFEALGCGLPYIGTNVGGVGEIINSDEYGLIYNEPNNTRKLAQLIEKALNKKWESNRIITYSRNFTWENLCKKIKEYYIELLKSK